MNRTSYSRPDFSADWLKCVFLTMLIAAGEETRRGGGCKNRSLARRNVCQFSCVVGRDCVEWRRRRLRRQQRLRLSIPQLIYLRRTINLRHATNSFSGHFLHMCELLYILIFGFLTFNVRNSSSSPGSNIVAFCASLFRSFPAKKGLICDLQAVSQWPLL